MLITSGMLHRPLIINNLLCNYFQLVTTVFVINLLIKGRLERSLEKTSCILRSDLIYTCFIFSRTRSRQLDTNGYDFLTHDAVTIEHLLLRVSPKIFIR